MNGRAYDYNLGRFLSVDPVIQSPGNSQSLNPYSYIMNNPLAGTDPSGYEMADEVDEEESIEAQAVEVEYQQTGSRLTRTAKVTQTSNGYTVQMGSTALGGASSAAAASVTSDLMGLASRGNTGVSSTGGVSGQSNEPEKNTYGLNLTQEEYLQAVEDGIWETAPVMDKGFKNNSEVKKAAARVNARQASSVDDVVSPDAYIEFLRNVSKATALANINVTGEKFLMMTQNSKGQVVVTDIGILPAQGGVIRTAGASAIAHVHYLGLEQKPGPGDHSSVKAYAKPSFVIGARGSKIWEVGRISQKYKYRRVDTEEPGRWRTLRGAK
ncbi:RHS repeat-associated core domain-containing protein [Microbulbifer sp. PAAF003]